MPVEIDENTRRCTLIGEDLHIEGDGPDIEIINCACLWPCSQANACPSPNPRPMH